MSSFRRTLTVRRPATGSYNASGFFERAEADTEFSITASVQPMSGREVLLLPENRREQESLKLYTSTSLRGIIKGSGDNPDIVEIDGSDYEVTTVFPWTNNVINHYKIFVSKRVTNNAEPPITP